MDFPVVEDLDKELDVLDLAAITRTCAMRPLRTWIVSLSVDRVKSIVGRQLGSIIHCCARYRGLGLQMV